MDLNLLDQSIRRVPDHPKPGILFYDITSILTNPKVFNMVIDELVSTYKDLGFDGICAVESRGFIFASPLALRLNLPLVLIRKKGKLPGDTYSMKYDLEYGSAEIEVHKSDIVSGGKYLIIDDLIATGGTLDAAIKLVNMAGAKEAEVFGVIGLPFLNYSKVLKDVKVTTFINYDSE